MLFTVVSPIQRISDCCVGCCFEICVSLSGVYRSMPLIYYPPVWMRKLDFSCRKLKKCIEDLFIIVKRTNMPMDFLVGIWERKLICYQRSKYKRCKVFYLGYIALVRQPDQCDHNHHSVRCHGRRWKKLAEQQTSLSN